jgi:hypothetical protein
MYIIYTLTFTHGNISLILMVYDIIYTFTQGHVSVNEKNSNFPMKM